MAKTKTVAINGKQYTGAVAREIEAALENKYVQERGAFYVAKLGRHIRFDYYKPEFLFLNTLGRLVSFVRNHAGDWIEVASPEEVEAALAAPKTEGIPPEQMYPDHPELAAAIRVFRENGGAYPVQTVELVQGVVEFHAVNADQYAYGPVNLSQQFERFTEVTDSVDLAAFVDWYNYKMGGTRLTLPAPAYSCLVGKTVTLKTPTRFCKTVTLRVIKVEQPGRTETGAWSNEGWITGADNLGTHTVIPFSEVDGFDIREDADIRAEYVAKIEKLENELQRTRSPQWADRYKLAIKTHYERLAKFDASRAGV